MDNAVVDGISQVGVDDGGGRRVRGRLLGVGAVAVLATAAVLLLQDRGGGEVRLLQGGPSPSPTASGGLPPGIAAACGRPGRRAEVPALRLVVRHAECDLTGVILSSGGGGVEVPPPGTGTSGNFDGISSSSSLTVTRAAGTRDVTFDARDETSLVDVSGVVVLRGNGEPDEAISAQLTFDSPDYGSSGGDGTNPQGAFTLQLYPGTYVLTATSPAYDGTCRADFVLREEPMYDVEVVCPRR